MINKNNKTIFYEHLHVFIKKHLNRPMFLLIFSGFLIFYILISFLDLGRLDFGYIVSYFIDSLSFFYIDRALKEGYIVRLISTVINIFSIIFLLAYLYRSFWGNAYKAMVRFYQKLEIKDTHIHFLLVLSIFMLISLKTDLDYMNRSGTVDLRGRIVGVRSMEEGYDPYFFKWKLGMRAELLDPVDYISTSHREVSRLTITPTALMMHIPFSNMIFSQVRVLWFCIQYISFLAVMFILVTLLSKTKGHKIIILIMTILFSMSYAWRIHVERGQIYVVYALVNSLFVINAVKLKRQENNFIAGTFLALLISLRPTFIVFLIPLFIFGKIKIFKSAIIAGIFLFSLTTLLLGRNIWGQYYNGVSSSRNFWEVREKSVAQGRRAEIEDILRIEIEGVENLGNFVSMKCTDSCVRTVLLNLFGIKTKNDVYKTIALFLTVFVAMALFLLKLRGVDILIYHVLIISNGIYTFVDLMMPVPRYSYIDMMIIPVLALIIYDSSDVKDFFIRKYGWVPILGILLGTSLLNTESFINPKDAILTGQILIYSYLIGYPVWLIRRLFKTIPQKI